MSTAEPWDLPVGWTWSSIGGVANPASGEWGEPPGESEIDVPVARSTEMRARIVDPRTSALRSLTARQLKKTQLRNGDVLINKSSGSARLVGQASLVSGIGDEPLGFSNFVLRLRAEDDVDGRYLHAFLASDVGRRLFSRLNRTTSGLRNLTMTRYLRVPVPRPTNPDVQRQVLCQLDEVDVLEQAAIRLEAVAQRLLVAEVVQRIGGFDVDDLPDGWKWTRVKELADPIRGMTFKPQDVVEDNADGAVQVLTTGSVQREVNWDEGCWLADDKVPASKELEVGDLIVSMSNSKALVGKVSLLRDKPADRVTLGAFIHGLRRRPNGLVSAEVLHAWLASGPVQQELRQRARQTTNIANLRPTVLNAVWVPEPPQHVVEPLARVAKAGDDMRRRAARLRQLAQALRDAVLAENLNASTVRNQHAKQTPALIG